MAKRAAPDEQPYRPLLDAGLMTAAIAASAPASKSATETPPAAQTASPKILDLHRAAELPRKTESKVAPLSEMTPRAAPQEPAPRSSERWVEKFDQEKRILFTRAETQAIDRLVTSLATRLNAQVKVSHVVRALVTLLLNAEGDIDKRAGEAGPLVRPPNGDALALQRFERQIAGIIGAALRDAGPIR